MSQAEAIATRYWVRNRSLERDDLVQQAHLAEAEARRTYREGRAPNLEAYQAAAVRRSLWGYVLKCKSPVSGSRDAIRAIQTAELPELAADDWEWRRRVRAAVANVLRDNPIAAEVLLLGYKPREVAEERRVPVGEVYRAIQRGKYRLRQSDAVADLRL